MTTEKKELNTMNAFACLLVILIHVLSLGITRADPASWQAALIFFPWRLASFVVPMFLFTGAVKVALSYRSRELTAREYGRYMLKRILKIYLPYVIWTVIYYLCFLSVGIVRGDLTEFLGYLLLGNIASPFYYIIIVMQFYILLPLWVLMIKKLPAYAGISLAVLAMLLTQQFPGIIERFGISFAYSDRVFTSYMIFWVIGLYVGKNYEASAEAVKKKSALTVAAAVVVFTAVLAYLQYRFGYFINLTNIKNVTDIMAIALTMAIALRLNGAVGWLRRMIDRIYSSSFSVYLSHCLFLTFITMWLGEKGVGSLAPLLIARFLFCFTAPFILYYLQTLAVRFLKTRAKDTESKRK